MESSLRESFSDLDGGIFSRVTCQQTLVLLSYLLHSCDRVGTVKLTSGLHSPPSIHQTSMHLAIMIATVLSTRK